MSNNSTIQCPNCKHEFPIENALSQKIEDDIRGKYLKRYNEDKQKLESEKAQLAKESEQLKLMAENQDRLLEDKLRLAKSQLQQEAIKKQLQKCRCKWKCLTKN